ncbi:MAG: C-terminal binding protein [Alphaproteobacteria bacterium]|nr:MAG: C-terminal binding protein [Alphaproteobacteria bacterium]
MRIVRTDRELRLPGVDAALRAAGHDLVLLPDGVGEAALAEAAGEADILMMCYTPVTARVIEGASRLRGIVKYGVGIDAIDIAAARARGIVVVNVPDYADATVAEAAFALMLALAKRLPALQRRMEGAGWVWPEPHWIGRDIAGSTVGVVGLGRIGRRFAGMARAFGAAVIAVDPAIGAAEMARLGVERIDGLTGLMARSDFVSLHAVLKPDTHHLIGAAELDAMKPTAFLINTARGALVDAVALIRALDAGRIAGAGLDVFESEPLARRGHALSPLYGRDNVILTPHLAFHTEEAMARLEREALARVAELAEGRPVRIRSSDPRLAGQAGAIYDPG